MGFELDLIGGEGINGFNNDCGILTDTYKNKRAIVAERHREALKVKCLIGWLVLKEFQD
jgi:hypothetical protein